MLLLSSVLAATVLANDNGLAKTPPLGWRSWNLYGRKVNQKLIESIMDGVAAKKMTVDGKPTSLCDLGYCDVGLDDNWQACGSKDAAPGMHYHDKDGKPIINFDLFPDLGAMVDHAHYLKLTAGWYGNNCICSDHCKFGSEQCEQQVKGDVDALMHYGFDSWKLDGCGGETNLTLVDAHIRAAGKAIMVENCHWGRKVPFKPDPTLPPEQGCPWNFYRTSGDVRASYASVMHNLGTVFPLHKANLSYPGCWAYPDMLQVGCKHGPGGNHDPGLSLEETRSHFGSWAIVSSPLTLSHDVNDANVTAKVWPIISNKLVLEINQAYLGDSGGVYAQAEEMVELTDAYIEALENETRVTTPSHQYLYKPVNAQGDVAVLLMNSNSAAQELTADFSAIPGVSCSDCRVKDVWTGKDTGMHSGSYKVQVASHDAAFLLVSAK